MASWFIADTETTGTGTSDKIVELAFMEVDDELNVLSEGHSLIDPEMKISAGASSAHHITNDMVADEPTIEQYMAMTNNPMYREDSVLVCHNEAFDYRYLKDWMHPDVRHLCTLRLARMIYPDAENHKLQSLRYELGLADSRGGSDAHRADGDVAILLALIMHMMVTTGLDLNGLYEMSLQKRKIDKWPFGKHKGKPLNCDLAYAKWLLKQDNVDPDLRANLEALV